MTVTEGMGLDPSDDRKARKWQDTQKAQYIPPPPMTVQTLILTHPSGAFDILPH